jgi:serine protease AprX
MDIVTHPRFQFLFLVLLLCIGSIKTFADDNPPGPWGFLPDQLPTNVTQEALADRATDHINQIWGFIGRDYAGKAFTQLPLPFLSLQAFDQQTRWPTTDRLPIGFDPEGWLDIGRDPGLQIRELNLQGLTGKGVALAIIDKPMLYTHAELQGRITYIDVLGSDGRRHFRHFHGIACASILAGKTCGVAPEASLYYFAVPDNGQNFLNYSAAVERLVKTNQDLPSDEKIRLVSISDGTIGPYQKEWDIAKNELKAAGVELIYSSDDILSGFAWGGCPPFLDRQSPLSYDFTPYWKQKQLPKDAIIIPADYRTTASNAGSDVYVYWGDGGKSWAIPYVAGLAALAWQVRPLLTYQQIQDLLRKTAFEKPDGSRVIQPVAFIDAVTHHRTSP